MRRCSILLPLVLLTVTLLAGCRTGVETPQLAGRIDVTPGSLLLTAVGAETTLAATVYDGFGQVLDVVVTWRSSDEAVLRVAADGTVTAIAEVGSAQVTAHAGGMVSAPVLALVAQTVPGAVLVGDGAVVGDLEAIDPEEDFDLGWRYRVRLAGIDAMAPGDLLIGTGQLPVGGRVTEVALVDGDQLVTLAVTALDELFTALAVRERISLTEVRADLSDDVLHAYDVTRAADGTLDFVPRPGAVDLHPSQAVGTRRSLGPFRCTTSSTFTIALTAAPSFTVTPSLGFDLDYDLDDGLRKVAVQGGLAVSFRFDPELTAAFEGSLACEAELFAIPIPIGGPMAFVLGGQVPIGVGFDLSGKVHVASLELQTHATGQLDLEVGIACAPTSDCDPYATGSAAFDARITPRFGGLDEAFRVEASLAPFAYADLAFGTRLFKSLRIQALRFTASVKQSLDLAPISVQVANTDYASNFALTLLVQAKVGSDVQKLLSLLKIKVSALTIDLVNRPLDQSPTGTFTISPATVAPALDGQLGELATFRVELDDATYLGLDAVTAIDIVWARDDGEGGTTLVPGRPTCRRIDAIAGQTAFECTTDFLEAHEGPQTFHAFVHADLFGVPLPVPLEVAKDARALVHVGASTCPVPPDFLDSGTTDASTVGDGVGEGSTVVTRDGARFTGSMRSTATSTASVPGPRVDMNVGAHDWWLVIPDAGWADLHHVRLRVRVTGEAWIDRGVATGTATCEATISLWFIASLGVRAACGERTASASIDETVEYVFNEDTPWTWIRVTFGGTLQAHGPEDVAEATAVVDLRASGAVDQDGNDVPFTLCSVSRARY